MGAGSSRSSQENYWLKEDVKQRKEREKMSGALKLCIKNRRIMRKAVREEKEKSERERTKESGEKCRKAAKDAKDQKKKE